MASWLKGLEHKMPEDILFVLVDTKAQESEFNAERSVILQHFRQGMGNADLQLEIALKEIDREAMARQRSLTPQEKLAYMKAKNPNVDLFLQHFDIQIDG